MKYNELYESEFLTDDHEIIKWMMNSFIQFNISNLKIESDGLVYDGDLRLHYHINEIEVPFKSVTGYFNCYETKISSLSGCPRIVGNYFSCSHATINSLKYCPTSVGRDFFCRDTDINPREYRYALYCEIGGEFHSDNTEIDEIINTYGGSFNRKHWPMAINLLSQVKL